MPTKEAIASSSIVTEQLQPHKRKNRTASGNQPQSIIGSQSAYIQAIAGETISVGKAIFIKSSDGLVYLADKSSNEAIGISASSASSGSLVLIQQSGVMSLTDAHVVSTKIFLGDSGALVAPDLTSYSHGDIVQKLGTMITTNNILIQIEEAAWL